ncbi:hypothetical protein [Pseudozobellia thermophila]|uniref:Peptidoglycan-binding protein LysM n=1 Tax=Pseudozobellia thermophila TaxID=192903 RepID=A0A1M6FBS1_9FLAO|nr:hypothetical protein [Pseudozobellia thermophila]SHI95086.1 hypothetical protein SAMN04488513_102367 [Pseudozobellia thermophila]
MRKWLIFTSPLIITGILMSFAFKPVKVKVPETLKVNQPTLVLFPKNKTVSKTMLMAPPFLGSSYIGFKEALAFKESQGNYFTTNTLGYLGKYQFGIGTLQLMGVYNATRFLNDPVLQERAFHTNIARNKWILRRDIPRFTGKTINGTVVTESGILAAAHLAGAGNVKKYLRSWGALDVADSYGTSIAQYMRKFSGYDVSDIVPKRNPKVLKTSS